MKTIERKKLTKQVKYFGLLLSVPLWTTYIGTDADGEVCAYESEPSKGCGYWYLYDINVQIIGFVDLEGLNWFETLVEV